MFDREKGNSREESIKVNLLFFKIEIKNPSFKGICIIILVLAFLILISL